MIDLQSLIDHINAVAQDPNDLRLPSEWSAHWAWTMDAIENDDLPTKLPLVAFYQGREVATPRAGSPVLQSISSAIVALVVMNKTEVGRRIGEIRAFLKDWQCNAATGVDRQHLGLYLSDESSLPCEPLKISGEYLWWQDHWLTRYSLVGR